MSDDVSNAIESNAQGPKSAMNDGEQVTAHSLPDQIEADRYLTAKSANASRQKGVIFQRLKPPGSV